MWTMWQIVQNETDLPGDTGVKVYTDIPWDTYLYDKTDIPKVQGEIAILWETFALTLASIV